LNHEAYEEALAYLIADAKHRHQLLHDGVGADHCRICESRRVRLQMQASYDQLPPEDLALFRIGLQVDATALKRR